MPSQGALDSLPHQDPCGPLGRFIKAVIGITPTSYVDSSDVLEFLDGLIGLDSWLRGFDRLGWA